MKTKINFQSFRRSFISALFAALIFFFLMWLIEKDITIYRLLIMAGTYFFFMFLGELFLFPYIEKRFEIKSDNKNIKKDNK